jgi:hypothetical protein
MTDQPLQSPSPDENTSAIDPGRADGRVIDVADTCFEIFTIRELKQPQAILPELSAAFPDIENHELLRAISLALTWKRLLKSVGRTLH